MTRKRASIVGMVAGLLLLTALTAACGPASSPEPTSGLSGEPARVVGELMDAHGGLRAFLALEDLEYDVSVDELDSSGVLLGNSRELHRFAAGAPRRYLLRRSGSRVTEYGLMGDEGWVRIDGARVDQPGVADEARRELAVLSFLHRAPFALGDPGWQVSIEDDMVGVDGSVSWRRLAVQRETVEGGRPERYVVLIDTGSGRVGQVLFETGQGGAAPPLRVATVREIRDVQGVALVSSWSLAPADARGRALQVDDILWRAEEVHADNGFTDDLYRSR